MITKVLNKYIDLSKVVGIGLINSTKGMDDNYYHIEIDFQLFEKTMIISLGEDDFQTPEENAQIKEEYQKLLKLWTSLINKPVETTNEQPNYKFEIVDINATDNPLKITNLSTKEEKTYGVEGLPWKMLKNDQEVLHYIFNNFKSDI